MLPDQSVATNRPFGASEAAIDVYTNLLAEQGYCIIADAVEPASAEAFDAELAGTFDETPFCTGGFYGSRTKRFGRLLARSKQSAALVQHEVILGVVERILSPWCDTIQLNLTQAIEIHPGALPQLPHRDQKRGSHASAPHDAAQFKTKAGNWISNPHFTLEGTEKRVVRAEWLICSRNKLHR